MGAGLNLQLSAAGLLHQLTGETGFVLADEQVPGLARRQRILNLLQGAQAVGPGVQKNAVVSRGIPFDDGRAGSGGF